MTIDRNETDQLEEEEDNVADDEEDEKEENNAPVEDVIIGLVIFFSFRDNGPLLGVGMGLSELLLPFVVVLLLLAMDRWEVATMMRMITMVMENMSFLSSLHAKR
jgi:hypothetical protein